MGEKLRVYLVNEVIAVKRRRCSKLKDKDMGFSESLNSVTVYVVQQFTEALQQALNTNKRY